MQLSQVLDYTNYMIKVATLAQTFQWRNVLAYDAIYREQQSVLGFRWGQDSSFLMQSQLRNLALDSTYAAPRNPHFPERANNAGYRGKGSDADVHDPKSGKIICQRWNGRAGCQLHQCRYSHVCRSCYGSHPEVQHKQASASGPAASSTHESKN